MIFKTSFLWCSWSNASTAVRKRKHLNMLSLYRLAQFFQFQYSCALCISNKEIQIFFSGLYVEICLYWINLYLEILLSTGYGGGGVQWEEGTMGNCGCRAWVGLSELISVFMGMWALIIGVTVARQTGGDCETHLISHYYTWGVCGGKERALSELGLLPLAIEVWIR